MLSTAVVRFGKHPENVHEQCLRCPAAALPVRSGSGLTGCFRNGRWLVKSPCVTRRRFHASVRGRVTSPAPARTRDDRLRRSGHPPRRSGMSSRRATCDGARWPASARRRRSPGCARVSGRPADPARLKPREAPCPGRHRPRGLAEHRADHSVAGPGDPACDVGRRASAAASAATVPPHRRTGASSASGRNALRPAPTRVDERKRPGSSTADVKGSAASGPTPGNVIPSSAGGRSLHPGQDRAPFGAALEPSRVVARTSGAIHWRSRWPTRWLG